MSDSKNQKLYDIRAGKKLFPSLSASIVIKNIKNGKLKPHHEISAAGSKKWMALEAIPELEVYFHPEEASSVQKPMTSKPVSNKDKLYDIRVLNDVTEKMPVLDIVRKIREGEYNETDRARVSGTLKWSMAGDMPVFERYFDLRRSEVAAEGMLGIKKDTGKPFYTDLIAPFKYIGTMNFLFTILVILLVLVIPIVVPIPIVSGPITFLVTFYIFAYYFKVINSTGSGGTSFPSNIDFSDFVGELIRPGISFFLTRIVSLLPLIAYLSIFKMKGIPFFGQLMYFGLILSMPWSVLVVPILQMESVPLEEVASEVPMGDEASEVVTTAVDFQGEMLIPSGFEFLTGDFFVWIGLLFFLFYFPISLLRQSSYGAVIPTFNVPAIVQSITRAPGPYLFLVLINLGVDLVGFVILFLIGLIMGGAAVMNIVGSMGNPGAAQMAGTIIAYIFPLVMKGLEMTSNFLKMYFMGRFMYQNSQKMGWD